MNVPRFMVMALGKSDMGEGGGITFGHEHENRAGSAHCASQIFSRGPPYR